MSQTVVLGYDGSDAGRSALEWAVTEAKARGAALRVVVAWTLPPMDFATADHSYLAPELVESQRDYGTQLLADAEALAADRGCPTVTGTVVTDAPAHALLAASREADLVVVGSRGLGGFSGLLLGSVSRQVATHAKCSTVIVKDQEDPAATEIVVGVDGSDPALKALDFAYEQADRHGSPLRVIHTWEVPPVGAITGVPVFSPPELIADLKSTEARITAEALAGHGARYPDVQVTQDLRQGGPVQALADASRHAAMVVVGSRGRGGFMGLLLGSVSHGVAHHARCPVAVVR